jgi:hypothetical protein
MVVAMRATAVARTGATMKSSGKWKDKLLSSSVPLEFECANLFRSHGFLVGPEYSYSRLSEGGVGKEFSVDFLATNYPIFEDDDDLRATLEVPVECKYRTVNKCWLFLPEPDEEDSVLGQGLRAIDEFSAFTILRDATRELNARIRVAYKGVEINLDSGDVHDADLKHGIYQLKYALPGLVAEHIVDSLHYHPEDNQPLFLFPLLVTTAKLWIFEQATTIGACERAKTLEHLASEVPYLTLRTRSGADFQKHVAQAFGEFKEIESHDRFHVLTRRSADCKSRHEYYDPIRRAHALASGHGDSAWFDSFVICNFVALPSLLTTLKTAINADVANIQFSYPKV